MDSMAKTTRSQCSKNRRILKTHANNRKTAIEEITVRFKLGCCLDPNPTPSPSTPPTDATST
jgi:hypothetical protein